MSDHEPTPPPWPPNIKGSEVDMNSPADRLGHLSMYIGERTYFSPFGEVYPTVRETWMRACQMVWDRVHAERHDDAQPHTDAVRFMLDTIAYVAADVAAHTLRVGGGPLDIPGIPVPDWPGNESCHNPELTPDDTVLNTIRDIVDAIAYRDLEDPSSPACLPIRQSYLAAGEAFMSALRADYLYGALHSTAIFINVTVDYVAADVAAHTLRTRHVEAVKGHQ